MIVLTIPVSAKPASLELIYLKAAPVFYRATDASTCIGYLPQDTVLTVLDQQDEYYLIDCYDMTGFIHQRFVRFDNGEYRVSYSANTPFLQRPVSVGFLLQRRIYALSTAQLGVPYVSGGSSPRGFDCSGFTQYVFAQIGITIPRTCDGQLGIGLIIPKESLRCGDLVLFQRTTSHPGISTHVGIYLGDGKLIHAGSQGITVVELESSYFQTHYLCARRIIPVEGMQPELICAATFAAGT